MAAAVEDGNDPPSLEALTRNLSRHTRSNSVLSGSMDEPECCCGKEESCPVALRTRRMMEELEGQVQIAGTLGQALLRRHETTMAEAQKREQDLLANIDELEHKTTRLENMNADTLAENRMLRQNLEDLEADMKISETRVKEMQEALDESHSELSRVAARAARADVLEARLSVLENEQEELRNTIVTTREEERAATARWRKSERALQELGEQLERITHEHALEKARSRNILERLEQQQRSTQVQTRASGSGAASAAPGVYEKASMSRFMKEILAENGHLQMGIAELRELLAASQEEVNQLREKLESAATSPTVTPAINTLHQPLSMELERTPSGSVQTVVHHHHYHAQPIKEKVIAVRPPVRRSKRRKPISGSDFSEPPSSNRLSGLGLTNTPPTFAKRWSHVSKASTSSTAPSSFPTSPSSTYQASIFDRFDTEDSRPTSAGSDFDAKPWQRYSTSSMGHTRTSSTSTGPSYHHRHHSSVSQPPFHILHTTAESENEGHPSTSASHDDEEPYQPRSPPRTIRRTVSHESMLSVVSVNTLNAPYHPSPAVSTTSTSSIARRLGRPGIPTLPSSSSDGPSAVITPGVAIRAVDSSRGYSDSAYSRLLGLQGLDGSPPKYQRPGNPKKVSSGSITGAGSGGWLWRWGASMAESRLPAIPGVLGRSHSGSGNASGSESGGPPVFRKKSIKRAATEPVKRLVDVEGLRDALSEAGESQ